MDISHCVDEVTKTSTRSSKFLKYHRIAEREGFEPPSGLTLKWFSRPPHSTTLPSLQLDASFVILLKIVTNRSAIY